MIRYSAVVKYLRNNGSKIHPCINFKEVCDSVRREVLYNIFVEFGITVTLVRLIKMLKCVLLAA